jgi:hypothetical protein
MSLKEVGSGASTFLFPVPLSYPPPPPVGTEPPRRRSRQLTRLAHEPNNIDPGQQPVRVHFPSIVRPQRAESNLSPAAEMPHLDPTPDLWHHASTRETRLRYVGCSHFQMMGQKLTQSRLRRSHLFQVNPADPHANDRPKRHESAHRGRNESSQFVPINVGRGEVLVKTHNLRHHRLWFGARWHSQGGHLEGVATSRLLGSRMSSSPLDTILGG